MLTKSALACVSKPIRIRYLVFWLLIMLLALKVENTPLGGYSSFLISDEAGKGILVYDRVNA